MLVTNGTDRIIKLVFYRAISEDDMEIEEDIVLHPGSSIGAAFLKGRAYTIEDVYNPDK